jgi:predicted Rossmann fold nucleotide-binding protein DprA/Smf involved in DNA uptake
MEFSDDAANDGAVTASTRRGRPRSQETIQRDEAVLKTLGEGPKTKEQLVQELGVKDTHVYLSLWRLRRDGKVEKVADADTRHLWRVVA